MSGYALRKLPAGTLRGCTQDQLPIGTPVLVRESDAWSAWWKPGRIAGPFEQRQVNFQQVLVMLVTWRSSRRKVETGWIRSDRIRKAVSPELVAHVDTWVPRA